MNVGGLLLAFWVVFALVGMAVGSTKGKAGLGFVLGLLLGLIGVVIIAVMSPTPEVAAQRNHQIALASQQLAVGDVGTTRACPFCAEQIQRAAIVCRYCGRDVPPVAAPVQIPGGEYPEGWFPDPFGRHPDRWWNGAAWTKWVRDKPGGTRDEDPVSGTVD